MASDPKKRQKQLAKKKAKRKNVVAIKKKAAGLFGGALSQARQIYAAQSAPLHECLMPDNLFEIGMGNVIFARKMGGGEYAVGCFLLDVFCLGVKDAFFTIVDTEKYAHLYHAVMMNNATAKHVHPTCLRKLVEGAEAYAQNLGFKPHDDYKLAKQIFADTDASACPVKYEYGKDGQPFYISGPHDNQAKIKKIQATLDKSCGAGNYKFLILAGGSGDSDIDDFEDDFDDDSDSPERR